MRKILAAALEKEKKLLCLFLAIIKNQICAIFCSYEFMLFSFFYFIFQIAKSFLMLDNLTGRRFKKILFNHLFRKKVQVLEPPSRWPWLWQQTEPFRVYSVQGNKATLVSGVTPSSWRRRGKSMPAPWKVTSALISFKLSLIGVTLSWSNSLDKCWLADDWV